MIVIFLCSATLAEQIRGVENPANKHESVPAMSVWKAHAVLSQLDDMDNFAVTQLTTYTGCFANLERLARLNVLRNCIIWTNREM